MKKSEHNLIQSLDYGERVTSSYAEIYYDDKHCEYRPPAEKKRVLSRKSAEAINREWVSPSDLLIGKIDLIPPFTSKITRGYTHKGILEIGDSVLQRERDKFLKHVAELLADNDSAWTHIHEQEKLMIAQKVKGIYEKIFQRKSAALQKEISMFYEDTLREMEKHLRTEVRLVLINAHCSVVSDLNTQIAEKLKQENSSLEKNLRKRYDEEINKINKYYSLLINNEKYRSNKMINNALIEQNNALNLFCKHIEDNTATSTMYVMCSERKKCRMRQFLLKNIHTKEIEENLKTVKEKQNILNEFNKGKKQILEMNKEWEEKVKKILQLFLKFISFSLKLLPEQTTFLLDLEKLVVLQLNEIQKHPKQAPHILINEDDFKNIFDIKQPEQDESVCEGEPFVIEGDLSPSIPTLYGSRETIPSHVELPFVRLQRQFIYAKCQRMDEVRNYLDSLRCKCQYTPIPEPSQVTLSSSQSEAVPSPSLNLTAESSNELFIVDDIKRLRECPKRGCRSFVDRLSFPNLDEYFDFNEEKLARAEAILGKNAKLEPPPHLIDPKDIGHRDLLFSATTEPHRNVETQCSSQKDIDFNYLPCPCMDDAKQVEKFPVKASEENIDINKLLFQRKESLKRLIHDNPKLLKLFNEESFDFIH